MLFLIPFLPSLMARIGRCAPSSRTSQSGRTEIPRLAATSCSIKSVVSTVRWRRGRHLAFAPLERTDTGYRFNEKLFEAAIRDNPKLFILSHPHNPTGNVWTDAELRTMGEICLRHGALVISDEIHQDLIINPSKKHVPFASLDDAFAQNGITCTAPSKTFNLPGL